MQSIARHDREGGATLGQRILTTREGAFGRYSALDAAAVERLDAGDRATVAAITNVSKREALAFVSLLPISMAAVYAALWAYFRRRGG